MNESPSKRPTGRLASWRRGPCAVAAILAAVIFVVDSLTNVNMAIAVLYGLVVVIAAPQLERTGVLKAAGACALLTLAGYLIEHGFQFRGASALRAFISLAALGLATLAALKMKTDLDVVGASERRYRTLFESNACGLWEEDYSGIAAALRNAQCRSAEDVETLAAVDRQKLLAMMGRAKTLGVNEAAVQLLGARDKAQLMASLGDIYVAESLPLVKGLLTALIQRQPAYHGETQVRRFDGALTTTLVCVRLGSDERFERVFVAAGDLTDRVRVEEALRQARDELSRVTLVSTLGEVTAALAHEVNQPLAAVVTNGEAALRWLDRPQPDLDETRACVIDVVSEGRRAAKVVRWLRAMVENGAAERSPLDINHVVGESVDLLDREFRVFGVALVLDLAPVALTVVGDRVQLQLALVNLMLNAVQAMDGALPKIVFLQTRCEDSGVLIAIRDRGPGLSEEAMSRLFTPFFTTKSASMGMGLAICRSIVSSHGGRIWAENSPGDGAAFYVHLPWEAEGR
jgi:C4-dicarboxylate-specific signal transduction histidine kinase